MTRRRNRPDVHAAVRASRRATYREAILEAAERAFAELGYAATKMSDVSDAAGVAIGTLYNYFDSKEELFCALMERGKATFFAALDEVEAQEVDPLRRLERIIDATFTFLQEHGPIFAVSVQVFGGPATEGRMDPEARQRFIDRLHGCIKDAVDARELRSDIPTTHMALSLEGIVSSYVRSWIGDGCGPGLTDTLPFVFSLFTTGARKS